MENSLQPLLWIRNYFDLITYPGDPLNPDPAGSGFYLDIIVAIEKKYIVKYVLVPSKPVKMIEYLTFFRIVF
jgi:hypothetical protein